jgi:hypothetical protein
LPFLSFTMRLDVIAAACGHGGRVPSQGPSRNVRAGNTN